MSYERRLVLTGLITLVIMFIWYQIFPPPAPPKPNQLDGATPTALASPAAGVTPVNAAATAGVSTAPGETAAPASPAALVEPEAEEKTFVIERGFADGHGFRAVVQSRGASLRSWTLKSYKEPNYKGRLSEAEPAEMLHTAGLFPAPMEVSLGGSFLPAGAAYECEQPTPASVKCRRNLANGLSIEKNFFFEEENYTGRIELRVRNNGPAAVDIEPAVWTSAQRDLSQQPSGLTAMFSPPIYQVEAACLVDGSVEKVTIDSLSEPMVFGHKAAWQGVNEQFFIQAVALLSGETGGCRFEKPAGGKLNGQIISAKEPLQPGAQRERNFVFFIGPKDLKLLEKVQLQLDKSVDFGWFEILCRPMLWFLTFSHQLTSNWGIAIMMLTLLVKLILLRPTMKSYKSMKEMQKLKPEMDRLKAKHGEDRQKFNEELMKLYQAHGVNPLGGCLPVLIQMPIWFALYRTLYTAVDLYQVPFIPGWLDNMAKPDPWYILPLAIGVMSFIQQRMTPTPMEGAQQIMLLYVMPVMFTFIMFSLPSGLALYICFNSVLSLAQQLYINKVVT